MTINITVYPNLDPRIIVVDVPQTTASVQDIVNAIRIWEDNEENMSYEKLIDAAGKEDLGGGVSVGITATLQNAQLRFAARPNPLAVGTATSNDSAGVTLTDIGADFVSAGIYIGCTVFNSSVGALETVIGVTTTTLTTFPLQSGGRQDWQIGDTYVVYPNEICNITGGNLVAVDDVGDNIDPVFQAPNINVVRSSSSSATTSDLEAIQYSSYQNAVWVDINSSAEGTLYPFGTRETPVNNLRDAVQIAEERGFNTLQVLTSMLINGGTTDISGYRIMGQNHVTTEVELADSVNCANVTIENCNITGVLDGGVHIRGCVVRDVTYVNGHIHDCGLEGSIFLDGAENGLIANCYQSDTVLPIIDMGGSGQDLSVVNYTGRMQIDNSASPANVAAIGLSAGQVIINSNFTAGVVIVSGIGAVINNGTPTVLSTDGLMSKETISEAVLNTELAGFTTAATVASSLRFGAYGNVITVDTVNGSPGTSYPVGTFENPVDNVQDAATLATNLGIQTIFFLSNYVFDNTVDIANFHISGHGMTDTHFTFESGCKLLNCEILEAECTGVVDGIVAYYDCFLNTLEEAGTTPYSGRILVKDCLLHGYFKSPSNFSGVLQVLNCWSGTPGDITPTLNLNSNTADMAVRNYAGGLKLINCTNPTQNSVAFSSGRIVLDSSNTDGYFSIRGICAVTNEVTGSATVDTSALLNKELVSEAVWDESVDDHTIAGSSGRVLRNLAFDGTVHVAEGSGNSGVDYPNGTRTNPVDNLADAKLIADELSLHGFHIQGAFTLDQDYQDWSFIGDSGPLTDSIDLGGYDISRSNIESLSITGDMTGNAVFKKCQIDGTTAPITGFNGSADDCFISGNLEVQPGSISVLKNCSGGGSGAIIDTGGAGTVVTCSNLTSNWTFTNAVSGVPFPTVLFAEFLSGTVTLDSSCVGGVFQIGGLVHTIDNTGVGCIVNRDAQLQSSPGAYEGAVWIDTNNGSSGTLYPIGTKAKPINNLSEALEICDQLNIRTLNVTGTVVLDQDLTNYAVIGTYDVPNNVIVNNGFNLDGSVFERVLYTGVHGGSASFKNCFVDNVTEMNGVVLDTGLSGTITMGPPGSVLAMRNASVVGSSLTFDMSGPGRVLEANVDGNLIIQNMQTGAPFPTVVTVASLYGTVSMDSTCIGGSLSLSGNTILTSDDSTGVLIFDDSRDGRHGTGSWEGTEVIDGVAAAVWDKTRSSHTTAGSFGATSEWAGVIDLSAVADAVWDEERDDHTDTGSFGATDEWASAVDEEAIANAVWDEAADEHVDPNTMGEKQNTGGSGGGDPEAIADAVWDEASPDHDTDGTMGRLQNKIDKLVAAKPKIVPGE